jgi:hypothetical protein
MRDRSIYFPTDIRNDFVRKNAFEIIIAGQDPLYILCRSLTFSLPTTNQVTVPWISGVMQLAGRTNQLTFNATFLVGVDNSYDTLTSLYNWRNLVFDHNTGRIALAHEYKKDATINIYDITADADNTGSSLQYTFKAEGIWPTNIQDLTFTVDDDGVLEVAAQFAADRIYMTYSG